MIIGTLRFRFVARAAIGSRFTAGGYHSLALKSDRDSLGMGKNYYGQLGDGTTTDEHSPTEIGTETNWVSIAAGAWDSLALKSDGTLYAWGDNFYGNLGDGTTTDRHSPTKIGTETNWVSIAHEVVIA